MRRTWLVLLLALSTASAGAQEPCQSITGLEPQIRPGAVLLLGEIHGTAESPAFVGEIACHVSRLGLPVVVALELPVSGQDWVDAFLDSDGGVDARQALLAEPFWQRDHQDGRTSVAMLELIETVARLRRSGSDARVALFDTDTSRGGQARDRGMADRLAALVTQETVAVTVVLTGNLHSRTRLGRPGNADYEPMGYLLARDSEPGRIVALNQAHGGGTAWTCSADCGVAELGGRRGERPWEVEVGENPSPGHDGWYRIGEITASPPARLSAAQWASLQLSASPSNSAESRRREEDPTEPVPAGPLSSAESSVQGRWQGYDFHKGFRTWTLQVDARTFRAEGSGEWYEGRLVVDGDRQPAWIDFVIETCLCAYEGRTSQAIFGWQGESLLVLATSPGNRRPERLEAREGQLMRFDPQ